MKPLKRAQSGQATTEMILMMVIFVGLVSLIAAGFQRSGLIATIVSGPWQSIAGMAQNGVWGSPSKTMAKHPNVLNRRSTPGGEDPTK